MPQGDYAFYDAFAVCDTGRKMKEGWEGERVTKKRETSRDVLDISIPRLLLSHCLIAQFSLIPSLL